MTGRKKRAMMEAVGRPMMRSTITVIAAVGWFLLSVFIFQVYLPQFNYYERVLINQGTNDNDVWFIWAWIPTLLILVIGMLWSSGILGKLWGILSEA